MQQHRYDFDLKTPVTPRMLEMACEAVGVPVDGILDDPKATLDGVSLTPERQRRFLDVVCVKAPDLSEVALEESEQVVGAVLVDFFLDVWTRRYAGQIGASFPSTSAAAYLTGAGT